MKTKSNKINQLWNFNGIKVNDLIHKFTSHEDSHLDHTVFFPYDIKATLAHAEMLLKIKVITNKEFKNAKKGLATLLEQFQSGNFKYSSDSEDCHTTIEKYLTENFGVIGKKIHTARSRNDQVLTMVRLYQLENLQSIKVKVSTIIKQYKKWSKKNVKQIMPGYSHQQKAMPISVGEWQMVYADALSDILILADAVKKLLDQNPLGSGAGFGVPMNIDRKLTTKLLGFSSIQLNPLYCQFSRGIFDSNFIYLLYQLGQVFSKWANDLMMFTMSEFDYFYLPNDFSTGSSMMPNKKNYDVLELIRASAATLKASYLEADAIQSNLHIGYNRDYQNLKIPLVRSVKTLNQVLDVVLLVSQNLIINKPKIQSSITPELSATQKAYELTSKGVPFRDAYKQIKKNI